MTVLQANQLPRTTSHPLDMIPLFRRWPCSPARDMLYTGIWNTLMALVITVAGTLLGTRGGGFWDYFWPSLTVANCVGYMIHGSLIGMNKLLRGWRPGWRAGSR